MSLAELEAVLRDRKVAAPAGSYAATLLADPDLACRKIMEEAFELCLELGRPRDAGFDAQRAVEEAADLLFHVLAGLVGADVPLESVLAELTARRR